MRAAQALHDALINEANRRARVGDLAGRSVSRTLRTYARNVNAAATALEASKKFSPEVKSR
jgi:hypothetical protein